MLNNLKKKVIRMNPIDGAVILIVIILLGAVIVSPRFKRTSLAVKGTTMTMRVQNDMDVIYPEYPNIKDYGDVFINSVNRPVKVIEVKKEYANGGLRWLDITVLGEGEISKDRYIFNGQMVLVGQKVEIRSLYFARGIITEIRYADK